MKKINNKIQKIYSSKKQTKSTKLFILDKVSKYINVKRIFFIASEKKEIRGKHGHKKCTQVFVSLKGRIKINVFDGTVKEQFTLNLPQDILKVKPKNWLEVNFEKNQLLMVMCDKFFDKKDYIYSKKLLKK